MLPPPIHGHADVEKNFVNFSDVKEKHFIPFNASEEVGWWEAEALIYSTKQKSSEISNVSITVIVISLGIFISLYFTIKRQYNRSHVQEFIDKAPRRFPSILADMAMLGYHHYHSELQLDELKHKTRSKSIRTTAV